MFSSDKLDPLTFFDFKTNIIFEKFIKTEEKLRERERELDPNSIDIYDYFNYYDRDRLIKNIRKHREYNDQECVSKILSARDRATRQLSKLEDYPITGFYDEIRLENKFYSCMCRWADIKQGFKKKDENKFDPTAIAFAPVLV